MLSLPLAFMVYGLTTADITTIVLYFGGMLFIGYWSMKHVHNQEGYFLGNRQFGKLIQTFAAFGQATSASAVVTITTTVAKNGASGIWMNIAGGLFNMPVFWMTSVWYRRMRLLTLADFFEERYGSKSMAGFFAVIQALFFMMTAAMGLVAMSKTVAAISFKPAVELSVTEKAQYDMARELQTLEQKDYKSLTPAQQDRIKEIRKANPRKEFSYIDENMLIVVVAAVTLLYTVAGGLEAAFITDLIQGCFIIILTFILIPFAMMQVNAANGTSGFWGVFQTMHAKLPESFFELWGSPKLIDFTWYWIAAFSVLGVLNVAVQANQLTSTGSAKDEHTARYGFVTGIFMKRYAMIIMGFVALMCLVIYGDSIRDADYIWGYATRDLLGPVGLGLVGLMIACLMAALMSMASMLMLTTAAILTGSVYRPLVPGRSERHYVWVGRVFSTFYLVVAVLIAAKFTNIFDLLKFQATFNCILAAAFWLGILWRRTNRIGAWASMIITFVITLVLPFGLPLIPGMTTQEYLLKTTNPEPVTHVYTAREMDVTDRAKQIARWDDLSARGQAKGERPQPLGVGQKFEKTYPLPQKAVFWSEGLTLKEGVLQGKGYLYGELVVLDKLGWDLTKNPSALNETLTFLLRIFLPMIVILVVSLIARPEDPRRLAMFYGRMKTPVRGSHEDDAREMALTIADPRRFDHTKLFPRSNWEFQKWDRDDWVGIAGTLIGVAGCVVLLWLIVTVGG